MQNGPLYFSFKKSALTEHNPDFVFNFLFFLFLPLPTLRIGFVKVIVQ